MMPQAAGPIRRPEQDTRAGADTQERWAPPSGAWAVAVAWADRAEWEGNSLVAETRMANAEILTETFRASEDGNQIYVKTRFESPSLAIPVSIRRVYDLAPAPAK